MEEEEEEERRKEGYSSFLAEKEEYNRSLSFCSFFSCFTLSCISIIGCMIGSIQSKSCNSFALRATYSTPSAAAARDLTSPSATAVPSAASSSELSFDGASASFDALVAVALVVVSKGEEEKDELLPLLILAQAPDRTGRLFMSLRLHRLIVALLLLSPAIATSVASRPMSQWTRKRRLTYFSFFSSSSSIGSDKWIVYFVTHSRVDCCTGAYFTRRSLSPPPFLFPWLDQ